MLHIADSISRSVFVNAAPVVVWERSFATPAALASWFPDRIEGEFVLGQTFALIWGEHRCEARLVEIVPCQSLAYQWHPGDTFTLDALPESELTTVRFTLAESSGGTTITVVETGFSKIAESRAAFAFEQNNAGWDEELPKLSRSYEV